MKLLIVLLALMSEPDTKVVTFSGTVSINCQIGGGPIEFLFGSDLYDNVRIPLIINNDKLAQTVADAAQFQCPVTITGLLIEQHYRRYLLVDKVTP